MRRSALACALAVILATLSPSAARAAETCANKDALGVSRVEVIDAGQ